MVEKRKLRVAAVGVGSLGRHHARNYAELAAEGRVEFVGICDIDPATATAIGAEHSCGIFADWRKLLDKVDAVSIATPTESHAEIACGFLEKGIHVLVEKPIAIKVDDADQMIATAKKSGAKLMIGQLERFNPAMVALRPRVTSPLYFEIHRVSPFPNRSLDVDVVLDVMIHDLDAIQWLVGEDVGVREIKAVGIPVISDKVDTANVRIEFENGAVANITASRVGVGKVRKTRFYQRDSYVVLDYGDKTVSITSLDRQATHPLAAMKIEKLNVVDVEPLRAEITVFLDSIENDSPVPVTGEDGRRALFLAEGVLAEIERHLTRLGLPT